MSDDGMREEGSRRHAHLWVCFDNAWLCARSPSLRHRARAACSLAEGALPPSLALGASVAVVGGALYAVGGYDGSSERSSVERRRAGAAR